MARFIVGLDLGQMADFTALVVLEQDGSLPANYQLRHAQRFPLGTPYPAIVARVARRVVQAPLRSRSSLAVDATGVGPAVVDLLRQQLRGGPVFAITITAGTRVGCTSNAPTVPKRDLVTTAAVLLQTRRLRIAARLLEAEQLTAELLAYRVSISDSGHDAYAASRERDRDDVVLALCLAAWVGERRPYRAARSAVAQCRIPLPRITGYELTATLGLPLSDGPNSRTLW